MYQAPENKFWKGRTDPEDGIRGQRWHQHISHLDLTQDVHSSGEKLNIAFLGFCCDEGIRRNKGRVGAQKGPDMIRKAMAGFPVHFNTDNIAIFDAGNVICPDQNLEAAQELLGKKVAQLLERGFFPVLLGGGHEIAFGHFLGLHQHLKNRPEVRFGIINIDAHFDLRSYASGPSSGTPFRQIADLMSRDHTAFRYLCLGIQESGNTPALFDTAKQLNTVWSPAEELRESKMDAVKKFTDKWLADIDLFYLTLDLDSVCAANAPGVSAPNATGLSPFVVQEIILQLLSSGKLLSMDIAELSPVYDEDDRTAKLAAGYIYKIVQLIGKEKRL